MHSWYIQVSAYIQVKKSHNAPLDYPDTKMLQRSLARTSAFFYFNSLTKSCDKLIEVWLVNASTAKVCRVVQSSIGFSVSLIENKTSALVAVSQKEPMLS